MLHPFTKIIFLGVYGALLILFGIFILIKPEIVAYLIGILFILSGINALLIFALYFFQNLLAKKAKKEEVIEGEFKVIKEK